MSGIRNTDHRGAAGRRYSASCERSATLDELTHQLRDALESLDRARAEILIRQAIGCRPPIEVVESLIVPVLERLGEGWSDGTVALSQIYMSGRICEDIVGRLLPAVASTRTKQPRHAIVVLSDYHLLGKRIVLSVLRASGFNTLDYGRMEVEPLVERVLADGVDVLLVSVLMLPAALKVKTLREALEARGARVRIAVGGAPFVFDPELWQEVGADVMGRNAADAVAIVRGWTEATA